MAASIGVDKKLEMSDEEYNGSDDGSWLGFWIVIGIIVAIVLAAMYGYSQYTSVLQ
jgi:hypothetical protein